MKAKILTNSKALSCSRKNKSRKSGFVLVSVLMLGVLLISCATAFSWFVRAQVRTTGQELRAIERRSMADVLAIVVMKALTQVAAQVKYDSPVDQRWYQPFILPLGNDLGIWVAQVVPLDDKIPLRNLFLPDGNTLRREISELWEELWRKIGNVNNSNVVLDFIDRNDKPRVGSSEREEFINRAPYDPSELMMLSRDIPQELLYGSEGKKGFLDYCTVYSDGKININVAPVYVMELMPGLDTGGVAERIERTRAETPIKDMADLRKLPGFSAKSSNKLTNLIGFKSRYFLLKIECLDDTGNGGKSFNIILDRDSKQIIKWEES